MSEKHTPGPWSFKHRQGADGMYRTEIFSDIYGGIATCDWTPKHCGGGVTSTYREANARLMAAAPELLEALVEAYAAMEPMHHEPAISEALGATSAAFAKATGESIMSSHHHIIRSGFITNKPLAP